MAEAILTEEPKALPDPATCALDEIDVADPRLLQQDCWQPYFARLRAEDPVHLHEGGLSGRYWSVTKFDHIKAVDMNHEVFSSEPVIVIDDPDEDFETPMFIAMDPPKHDEQRKAVQPAVAPRQLATLEPLIRQRVGAIMDDLPVGEEFNWVERVSIELTTQMLATLFDFPFEDRHKLPFWSDCATASPQTGGSTMDEDVRRAHLLECLEYFDRLWREREDRPGNDFVSLMAHSAAYRGMTPLEYLGNLILLIVGGNDTTRNSITGGVYALNKWPDQYQKLRDDPSLIPNMVAEIIRWQTPLAHMRRTALEDVEFEGRQIRKGDRVVMWYVSGNRDEDHFEDADRVIIDRPNARSHVSFGYGIHRCMGNRLGEMQLRIVWEEILKRYRHVEVRGEPERVSSNFVKGYLSLPVVLHPH
ncbi:MAG TPA: cytochrome P450 [Pseudomonadales bacterium]|nr:cytochrome P450 [Pseudomonadales bacterium]